MNKLIFFYGIYRKKKKNALYFDENRFRTEFDKTLITNKKKKKICTYLKTNSDRDFRL